MNSRNQNTDPLSTPLCQIEQQRVSSESYEYKVNVEAHSQDIVLLKVADENVKMESNENTTEDLNSKCYSNQIYKSKVENSQLKHIGQNFIHTATMLGTNCLKTKNLINILDSALTKSDEKKSWKRKCHVPKCTTNAKKGFYAIPEHPKRRKEWLNAFKLPPSTKDMKICWKQDRSNV